MEYTFERQADKSACVTVRGDDGSIYAVMQMPARKNDKRDLLRIAKRMHQDLGFDKSNTTLKGF